jgi:amidase
MQAIARNSIGVPAFCCEVFSLEEPPVRRQLSAARDAEHAGRVTIGRNVLAPGQTWPYGRAMSTWVLRFSTPVPPDAVRVAVKDAIDMAGELTTAGSAAVHDRARPAAADAACLAGIRAAERAGAAVIVGKTGLTELCVSPAGDNAAFGMPVNPLAPSLIPGGSSSGSAAAVAAGEADVGLGTDTGGSVRIPAACCGIVGLKTTAGRVPLDGVWPLAPTLDTVGPIARDVAGTVTGMRLLEPGFAVAHRPARRIGRLRLEDVDPETEAAIDRALDSSGLPVVDVVLPGWDESDDAFGPILLAEIWAAHPTLLDADGLGSYANGALRAGRDVTAEALAQARSARAAWQAEVNAVLATVDVIALPTLVGPPPARDAYRDYPLTAQTAPVNLAGHPALAMPVRPGDHPVPASLQLIGPMNGEDLLCATGLVIEAALAD